MILLEKYSNVSYCELKEIQGLRFLIQSCTTFQILNWKECNVLDFESKKYNALVFDFKLFR